MDPSEECRNRSEFNKLSVEELESYIDNIIEEIEKEKLEERKKDEETKTGVHTERKVTLPAEEVEAEEKNSNPTPLSSSDTSFIKIHDIASFLDWLFSPKIMMRLSLIFACSLLVNLCYYTVLEALNRPVIVKAKQSRPFFSNTSARYVQDFYMGNAKPDYLLGKADLTIIMYYSPWSTLSVNLRHPFEVVAKFLYVPDKVHFAGVNCWATGSACRNSYKLMNYPVIAAYSGKASVMFTGTPSTDHLYRWAVRLQNHVISVNSEKELEQIKGKYQTVLIGYFSFKSLHASDNYKAFAAAGFMLASGNPQDDAIAFCITYSSKLAKHLGFRYEGDIQMLGTEEAEFFQMNRARTAQNIIDFTRRKASRNGLVRYISKPQDIVQNYQINDMLTQSPVLFLVTPSEPIYNHQDEIVLFSQLADEYWKCDMEILTEKAKASSYSRLETIRSDEEACDTLDLDPIELDNCCRAQLPSVDWNVACASSAKYRWEDEEETAKRRNHWTEEILALNPKCSSLRLLTADQLVHRCCSIYESIMTPYSSDSQRFLYHEKLKQEQKRMVTNCIRRKLAEHFEYSLKNSITSFSEDENMTTTIQGLGCKYNESLQFSVFDSKSGSYLLKKWGIAHLKQPLLVLVDMLKELFVVLDSTITQSSAQQFIQDYHGNLLNDYMLDENLTEYKFNRKLDNAEELNKKIRSQETIPKLTRSSFLKLIDNENSTFDQVIFFTGGVYHVPSTSVLFSIHTLSQYFYRAKELIRFYTIDVSKNELPYNFNFESVPSIVLFLAGRRDVSWKYPEMLPVTAPNLISFIVSRCSPKLRWKLALLNCDALCLTRNTQKLRKFGEKINRDLRSITSHMEMNNHEKIMKQKESKIDQLSAVRLLIRALATGSKRTGLSEQVIETLLRSERLFKLISTNFR